MKSPITGKEMKLIRKNVSLPYRKDEFSVVYHCFLCEKTKEQFTNNDLDNINQAQVHNQYREKYGIPSQEEIKKIRLKYDVSANKMSKILGFGANTYRLYEAGDIPTVSNGRLINTVDEPEEFIKQVKASVHILPEKDVIKLIDRAEKIEKSEIENIWKLLLEKQIFPYEIPNEYSGYRKPDYDKIIQIIAYFNDKVDLFKTKLNKFLFYADFLNYQKTGYSMTGLRYRAIPYGPVPAEYDKLYIKLKDEDLISVQLYTFKDGSDSEIIQSNIEFDSSLFSAEEINIFDFILKKFGKLTSKQIVDASHKEKAWIENEKDRNIISYQKYAFDI